MGAGFDSSITQNCNNIGIHIRGINVNMKLDVDVSIEVFIIMVLLVIITRELASIAESGDRRQKRIHSTYEYEY